MIWFPKNFVNVKVVTSSECVMFRSKKFSCVIMVGFFKASTSTLLVNMIINFYKAQLKNKEGYMMCCLCRLRTRVFFKHIRI